MYWLTIQDVTKGNGQLAVGGVSASCMTTYATVIGVTQSGYWPDDPDNYQKYLDLFGHIVTAIPLLGDGLGKETVYQGGAYRTALIT